MIFSAENITASYGVGETISNVSLTVGAGEVLCLLGRNGAGKTTVLRAIMGMMPKCHGRFVLNGNDISALLPHDIPKAGIGYVPQGRRLFAEMTVRENLEIGLMARRGDASLLEQIHALFPVLESRLHQVSGTLSGGEQQMLAMARALCLQPSLLLLDEPTEGLMPSMITAIRNVVSQLAKQGVAILIVEQRIEAVLSVADRVAFMENGSLKRTVDVDAVIDQPELIKQYAGVG